MGGRQYARKSSAKPPQPQQQKQPPVTKPKGPPPRPPKPPEEKHSAVIYLRTLGGISIVGLGALIPSHYYWWSVGIIYAGFLVLFLDVAFQKWKLWGRVLGCLVLLVLVALYSRFVVFVPAPLDVLTNATLGEYDDGKDVHGVIWEPGMTELRFAISNPTHISYDAIDLLVKPNLATRKVGQITSVPDVSLEILQKAGGLEIANFTVTAVGPDGKKGPNVPMDLYASPDGFRLRCASLPPNTTMQVEAGLVTFKIKSDNPATFRMGGAETGPKALATSVFVKGNYSVLNRPHHVEYTYTVGVRH